MVRRLAFGLAALFSLIGASMLFAPLLNEAQAAPTSTGPLVLAPSSMQEALSAVADDWARAGHPRPVLAFAASSALARQIEAGAPADLFISADEEWMDHVAQAGNKHLLRAGSRADVASNQLVLIAPKSSTIKLIIAPNMPLLKSLGATNRLAMADPDSVPAGRYGRQALTRFGVWNAVQSRVVRAENVRAALALVARGEAALGVVYATDAQADAQTVSATRVVGVFPENSHAPIRYPLAILNSTRHADSDGFRRYLLSKAGQTVFRRYGFSAP